MEKRFKLGIPCMFRMFSVPFLSCSHRDAPQLVQEPMFIGHRDFDLLHPCSTPVPSCPPRSRSLPTLCRSRRWHMTSLLEVAKSPVGEAERRRRRRCPPAPPASPLVSCIKSLEVEEKSERKKKKRKKKLTKAERRDTRKKSSSKRKEAREMANVMVSTPSSGDSYCFFSSDEEKQFEENEALFSSKSFSSDSSSESHRLRLALRRRTRPRRKGRSCRREEEPDSQFLDIPTRGKADQSVAVVKSSSDPYSDFRISMVEMIIEKQIFGAKDLEMLLDCFLALNAPYHHRVIVEVFEEICEALFCNWS